MVYGPNDMTPPQPSQREGGCPKRPNDQTTKRPNDQTPKRLIRDAVVSFNVGAIHHLDMGTLLDRLGIAVRTGHHCAQPLMDRLGIAGTVRASFALYNTKEEVDVLVAGVKRVSQMF